LTEGEEGILKHLSSLETFLRIKSPGFPFRRKQSRQRRDKGLLDFCFPIACRSASARRQGNDTINWAIEDGYQSAKVLHFFLESEAPRPKGRACRSTNTARSVEGEAVIPKEERIGEKRDNESLNFR